MNINLSSMIIYSFIRLDFVPYLHTPLFFRMDRNVGYHECRFI